MDSTTLTVILIAASVALAAFLLGQFFVNVSKGERGKLRQRLSSDMLGEKASNLPRSITRQIEATGFSATLVKFGPFQWLYARLLQAWPDVTLQRFLAIVLATTFGLGLIVFILTASLLASAVAAALGAYVPVLMLTTKRNRRQRTMGDQLPEALDFLSRVMRAGHSLTTGLQMMGDELPKPLGQEFRRCYDQHSLGQPLEECLKDMAARVECTDFAFFVTAVLIQRQTGGDLSEVLGNISGMIRQRLRLQQHVKAKTAEGRLTGYILVAFPAVMFVLAYVLNPSYGSTLINSSTGKVMLGIAFGLQMLGLVCIRKITTVKV
ncbi:MAG: type II secretion system F family protein [Tepidisphaeraceae bacterium]